MCDAFVQVWMLLAKPLHSTNLSLGWLSLQYQRSVSGLSVCSSSSVDVVPAAYSHVQGLT